MTTSQLVCSSLVHRSQPWVEIENIWIMESLATVGVTLHTPTTTVFFRININMATKNGIIFLQQRDGSWTPSPAQTERYDHLIGLVANFVARWAQENKHHGSN